MRFCYRHTDGFYKKMLNSEFLEVSIFCICRFLHDETGRNQRHEKRFSANCGGRHTIVWRLPRYRVANAMPLRGIRHAR